MVEKLILQCWLSSRWKGVGYIIASLHLL